MRALLESTWNAVQGELKTRAGAGVYESWLSQLRPLVIERGVVHLEGRNRMSCAHVDRFYSELLADVLSTAIGTRVGIRIEPAPDSLLPDALEVGPARPIIDSSNETAWLLLQAVFEGRELPARQFLFHGPAGSGKSFLLDWWRTARGDRGRTFTGPQLCKAFQSAIRDGRTASLRAELVTDDDLVVDELHRVAGHTRVQRELARVLEARQGLDSPTLLASRWHPHEIRDLDAGFVTWLMSGFVTRIELPGPSARLAYLRALEGTRSRNGRSGVIETLAREVQGGYPELRRAWSLERQQSTEARARYFELIDPRSTFERLLERVVARLDVDRDDLVGKTQRRRVSAARKLLAWRCVKEGLSRAEVGRYLGRTRAAVSYSIKSLEAEMERDAELRRLAEGLL